MSDKICAPFPTIPGAPLCSSGCEKLSLCKLPRAYPRTTAVSTLQDAYTFTDEHDFNAALTLVPTAYNIGEDAITDTDDPCSAEVDTTTRSFYSYIDVIAAQERKTIRDTKWVLDFDDHLCTKGTTGITKGPSFISLFNTIQEVMAPPTVTPGIAPGISQKGTRIPKPKGDCEDGIWVLTYVNGKLEWTCDNGSSTTPIDCDKLRITKVRILTASGGSEVTGTIPVDVINNAPKPVIEVSWEYDGWYMPAVGLDIKLANTAQTDGMKMIASTGWINSPYMESTVVIGPTYSDESESPADGETVTISDTAEFLFSWSAVTCYDKLQAADNYTDTDLNFSVSVPSCPSIKATQVNLTATCTAALGVLAVKNIYIMDEFGIPYPDNKLGGLCDAVRSGEFYVYIEYINPTDYMYVDDSNTPGIAVASVTNAFAVCEVNKVPSQVSAHGEPAGRYKVKFKLNDDACNGDIVINVPIDNTSLLIPINPNCSECPGFKIDSITLFDATSMEPIVDPWNIGCTTSASRRIVVSVEVSPDSAEGGYRNIYNDKIKIKCTPGSGVTVTPITGDEAIVPDIALGDSVPITLEFIVTTDDKLEIVASAETISATVNFSTEIISEVNASTSTDKETLSIIRACGSLELVPGSARVYLVSGLDRTVVAEPINSCVPRTYELIIGYELQNTSKDATVNGPIAVTYGATGGLTITPSKHEVNKDIVNLRPGNKLAGYSPVFLVTTTNDKLEGEVNFSIESTEHNISTTLKVEFEADCSSSSSGDFCSHLQPGNHIDITTDTTTGRCQIDCLLKEGTWNSIDKDGKINNTLQSGTGVTIATDGKLNIDTKWLADQLKSAITAWFADTNNVTKCD